MRVDSIILLILIYLSFYKTDMNAFLLFLLFIDPKVEYKDNCKKCHESPAVLFGGKLKTKDLRKTIYDMYRVDSSEKPTKAQVDAMLKYAKSFKK